MESFQLPQASGSQHKQSSRAFLRLRPHYPITQCNEIRILFLLTFTSVYHNYIQFGPILIPIAHFRMIITEFTLKSLFISFDALDSCPSLSLSLPILILDISLTCLICKPKCNSNPAWLIKRPIRNQSIDGSLIQKLTYQSNPSLRLSVSI